MRNPIHQANTFTSTRAASDAGIAIGAILFVLALLGVVAVAMSSGSSSVGSTIVSDRIRSDLKAQGNLIRSKILECNQYSSDRGELTDKYPYSDASGTTFGTTATLVSNLHCLAFVAYGTTLPNSSTGLWTGAHPATLPAPSSGMEEWYYVNAGATGGRCIRIQPLAGSVNDAGIKAGLAQAASGFSTQEVVYSAGSGSQRFILWITSPSGAASADCSS